jgi:hypothetical protein
LIGRGGFTWCELNIATPTGRSNIARKFIYYNISGKPEWHKGHKRWKKTDKANEEVLGAIQAGDIVQVIPKARFKGWVNHIRDMELEVHITTSSESKEIRNKDDGVPKPNYDLLDANKKHIRLLALLPGTSPDPVAVKLLSGRPLEDTSTQFEALSYVWGNISNKETIELHQHDTTIAVSISSGLYGALLHLRNPVSTRTLWIDQLCINQSDTNELAYQVSMMGEIYARASNVIVWLGHGSEHTRIAVEAVQAVLSKFTSPNLDSGFGPSKKPAVPNPK